MATVILRLKLIKLTCGCGCTFGCTKNEIHGRENIALCPSCGSKVHAFLPFDTFDYELDDLTQTAMFMKSLNSGDRDG